MPPYYQYWEKEALFFLFLVADSRVQYELVPLPNCLGRRKKLTRTSKLSTTRARESSVHIHNWSKRCTTNEGYILGVGKVVAKQKPLL